MYAAWHILRFKTHCVFHMWASAPDKIDARSYNLWGKRRDKFRAKAPDLNVSHTRQQSVSFRKLSDTYDFLHAQSHIARSFPWYDR
jgi:hypothetical protein